MVPNQTISDTADWPIMEGMTVYGVDGEKLGTVRNYDPQADYLDVQKGWLFHKDFYVPVSTVNTVMGDGLTLRLTSRDLDDERYATPPIAKSVEYGEGFILMETVQKEPVDVESEEVPQTRDSGMPVY
jgi:hypothetical protein